MERKKQMNKKLPLLLLVVASLTACNKTKLLYGENAYNSPVFDENYYTTWDKVDELNIEQNQVGVIDHLYCGGGKDQITIGGNPVPYTWTNSIGNELFGYHYNLGQFEKKFNYGVTSKLFDGRVECGMLYQKSRVQLNRKGFAMFFPKTLYSTEFLGFAARGGTNLPNPLYIDDIKMNFTWSFYIHIAYDSYRKVTYTLNDIPVPTDNGGATTFVNFVSLTSATFEELQGAVAMSFEWSCNDQRILDNNLTDDYEDSDKTKNHLALMLYEVFIGNSVWA